MATMTPPGGGRGGTGSTTVQSDDLPNRGFIAELSPALTAELIEGAPSVYYPEGSIIFSNGSRTTAALVVSGLLRYYMAGADGRELTVRYVGPGDMVGTLISERSSLSTRAQAIRPSVLLHLDVDVSRLSPCAARSSRKPSSTSCPAGCVSRFGPSRPARSCLSAPVWPGTWWSARRCWARSRPAFAWPSRSSHSPTPPARSARWWPEPCESFAGKARSRRRTTD